MVLMVEGVLAQGELEERDDMQKMGKKNEVEWIRMRIRPVVCPGSPKLPGSPAG